jgi:hypothetical protein
MWSFDQAKYALTLVQKWPFQNVVIDLCNNKISKDEHIKSEPHFKPIPTNLMQKGLIFCL